MKKLIVILTGGGARGAFQAGVWNRIMKDGLNFGEGQQKVGVPDAVFGVSAGALNGAMIAMGKNRELIKLWNTIAGRPQEIYQSDFLKTDGNKVKVDTEAIGKYLLSDLSAAQKLGLVFRGSRKRIIEELTAKLTSLPAIADNSPLFGKIQSLVKLEDVKSNVFQAGFVSLTDGNYYTAKHTDFDSNEQFQKAVLASSTIPVVWPAVDKITTKNYEVSNGIDGGLRNVNPLGDAVKYVNEQDDEHEYYFLIVSTRTASVPGMHEKPSILNVVDRSVYDIALNEIGNTDASEFLRINRLVKQVQRKNVELLSESGRKLRSFKVKVIEPLRDLGGALNFSRTAVMDSFLHGYLTAHSAVSSPSWE